MTSHKRAATELLPTHRDPKLARIMAGDTVVHKDKTTGNGSVLQRWGTLGKDALVLVKDTTNAVLQSLGACAVCSHNVILLTNCHQFQRKPLHLSHRKARPPTHYQQPM
jgi:hypothetical protein